MIGKLLEIARKKTVAQPVYLMWLKGWCGASAVAREARMA
jgi:hypothetical protein